MTQSTKLVAKQNEWGAVAQELEAENLKLASYDNTVVGLLGQKVLDYGAGPGVLALGLQKMGAKVKVYDVSTELLNKAAERIGEENIYRSLADIPYGYFDVVICNLVLCIVPEDEALVILKNIYGSLAPVGRAYIGFCNPKIYDVEESNLDFRFPTGAKYEDNHDYKKIKKEGGYEIIESHRPVEWYEKAFQKAGLKLLATHFTPEYDLHGQKIKDFIVFELSK